jgi:hypothetical protein
MATLSIEVPDKAVEIVDFQDRPAWFVEEQIKIDHWRRQRQSGEVSKLIDAAYAEAEGLAREGFSAEEARQQFMSQWSEFKR